MTEPPYERDAILAELVDGTLSGPEWDAWLAARPDAAAEYAIARRVRLLMQELELAAIQVPAGFEARVLERVREDRTLLDLIDVMLSGFGRTFIELLSALFGIGTQPIGPVMVQPA